MNRTVRTIFAVLAAAAFAVGFAAGTSRAEGPVDAAGPSVVLPPEAALFDNVIDAAEMDELVDINARIEEHLSIGADGLVVLDPSVTAADLGVDEEFLAYYRAALADSNRLIARGDIRVDADMRVTPSEDYARTLRPFGPQPGGAGFEAGATDAELPDAAPEAGVPDWSVWGYNTGAMFYNSYSTYNQYRSSYYSLCNSMAAYLRCSRCGSSLVNFYTYNSSYNNNYCYRQQGLYYYLPYQNTSNCGGYNPCYGNNTGYKPAYYWGYGTSYNNSCRCYTSQWQWYGYWCRY